MKAYKFEIVGFDPNGDYDLGDMIYELEDQEYGTYSIISVQSTEIGEWDDDHPLNNGNKQKNFVENAVWEPETI
jgi:hypothetical protein